MRKQGGKTSGLINEKLPKLDEETRKRTDLQKVKNFQNLARKSERKTK